MRDIEFVADPVYAISAALPATYDAAGYAAPAMNYTDIGGVTSARTRYPIRRLEQLLSKVLGSPDYGGFELAFCPVPTDAGQVLVKEAEASANHYSLKITFKDGEISYLDVLVLESAGEHRSTFVVCYPIVSFTG